MLPECPHCFTRVIPSKDGICPSCGKDMEAPPEDTGVSARISKRTKFPNICHQCGVNTTKTSEISEWKRESVEEQEKEDSIVISMLSLAASMIFLPLGFVVQLLGLSRNEQHLDTELRLSIPTCGSCDAKATTVVDCSIEKQSMRILVDRRFAEQVSALNESEI